MLKLMLLESHQQLDQALVVPLIFQSDLISSTIRDVININQDLKEIDDKTIISYNYLIICITESNI